MNASIFFSLNTETCRDAVQTEWLYKKRKFCLVDTAGLLKITPQKDFLDNKEEKKRMRAFEATGKFNTSLPGVQVCLRRLMCDAYRIKLICTA